MVLALIIGVAVVAIFILIFSIAGKVSVAKDESGGIKKVKGKNNVLLIAPSLLDFNLTIGKTSFWTRLLGGTSLFRIPNSGDAEFDRLYTITAYRDDVLRVMQTNAEFRRTVIQLVQDAPGFSSLCYAKGKLTLAIAAGPYASQKPIDATRDVLAATLPRLFAPFERLPIDTASEARARAIDFWTPLVPIMSLLFLSVLGVSADAPLADGAFPWKIVMQGCALYFVVQMAVLFFLTGKWQARLQGSLAAFFTSLMLIFIGMPGIVCAINANVDTRLISSFNASGVITETVVVKKLQTIEHRRGPSHYYLLLANPPTQLVAAMKASGPALEINRALFDVLDSGHLPHNSQVEITEVTGSMGLVYVAAARPL
ncbi:MAG TPA: hypothetical protein VNW52_06420 [Burkholderiaceae bacterium]|jgi:hypothetical protein|nr:hypothetical protein [Burkholderiaceae bacterium]